MEIGEVICQVLTGNQPPSFGPFQRDQGKPALDSYGEVHNFLGFQDVAFSATFHKIRIVRRGLPDIHLEEGARLIFRGKSRYNSFSIDGDVRMEGIETLFGIDINGLTTRSLPFFPRRRIRARLFGLPLFDQTKSIGPTPLGQALRGAVPLARLFETGPGRQSGLPSTEEEGLEIREADLADIRIRGDLWGRLFGFHVGSGTLIGLGVEERAKMRDAKLSVKGLRDKTILRDGRELRDVAITGIEIEAVESAASLSKAEQAFCRFSDPPDRQHIHGRVALLGFEPETRNLRLSGVGSHFHLNFIDRITRDCVSVGVTKAPAENRR